MHIQFDFLTVLHDWPLLLTGVCWTIGLTAVATVIGFALGIAFAWSRASGPVWLKWVVGSYVELIRNTPFIVQLFFVFFGLPAAGIKLSPDAAAMVAMVASLSAYSTEIVRSGLNATPRGQIEAAQSLALSRLQIFLHVVLPPALSKVWPAVTGQIILVMLGSAVCGQISVPELSYASNLIQSRNFRSFETSIVVTLIYLMLAVVLRRILNWAGPRLLFRR